MYMYLCSCLWGKFRQNYAYLHESYVVTGGIIRVYDHSIKSSLSVVPSKQ